VKSPCVSVGTVVSTFAEEITQHEEAAKSRHISGLDGSYWTALQKPENAATDRTRKYCSKLHYALYLLNTGITIVDTHEQRLKMMAENRRLTNCTQWMI